MEELEAIMDVTTIEQFFVQDYIKLRELCDRQRDELNKLRIDQKSEQCEIGGFVDLHTSVNLIYINTHMSSYYLFDKDSPLKDADADLLRDLCNKPQNELVEYLKKLKVSSYTTALSVVEHKFPFTLQFATYKELKTFAYDPDYDDDALFEILDHSIDTDCWVVTDLKDNLFRLAVGEFKETVKERIKKLESEGSESE